MATLLHHWKFDENSGQYAADEAGNSRLKLYDSVSGDRYVNWDANGHSGACVKGDGTTVACTSIPACLGLGAVAENYDTQNALPQELTVTLWAKGASSWTPTVPWWLAHLSSDSDPRQRNLGVWYGKYGGTPIVNFGFVFYASPGTYRVLQPPYPVNSYNYNDDAWHFIACTMSVAADMTKLYIDDCENHKETYADSVCVTSCSYPTSDFRWRIGAGSSTYGFTCGATPILVDEIRVFDGILTPEEICAIKNEFEPKVANALMFSCNT